MYNFSFICRASKIDKKGFAPIEFGSPAKVLAKESPNRDQRAKRIQFLLKADNIKEYPRITGHQHRALKKVWNNPNL